MMSPPLNGLRHKERLDLLLELIGQINSNLDINKVLLSIIDAAKFLTGSEACSVFLIDDITNELILSIPSGPAGDTLSGKRFPVGEGIAGWVAENAKLQIVNNVTTDNRFRGDFNPDTFTTRNILCAPLINQAQRVIGVLQAINKKDGTGYMEEEIPLFRALASQAANAITNARLHEERTALLGEVHHRVKNNMAVVSSLIQMQALMEQDEHVQSKLLNNVARITSMAVVHEQLYKSENFSRLNFAENIKQVVINSINSLNPSYKINTSFQTRSTELSINQSIPCSLIVNELIIQMVKYGFKNTSDAKLTVKITENESDEWLQLMLIDNGRSIRSQIEKSDNQDQDTGFQLIDVLSRQLDAEYTYSDKNSENIFDLRFSKSDANGAASHNF